jgi:hypothetical protein
MKAHKLVLTLAAVLLIVLSLPAQTQDSQSMKLLRLKSAQLSLELKKADFNRYLKLKEDGPDLGGRLRPEADVLSPGPGRLPAGPDQLHGQ